ncbi:MAG: 2-succinyl-5-enolpyruvyl-6-hydroxy-3-cyclohexene-carboxylic-acid synthase [Bacteroidota bacterium]|jgi:2-succinyl-5-enolpyruvyl-6-hydroxy-3-cyclohexene-1-carboxylate synthase
MAFRDLKVPSQVVLDERSAAHWALGAAIATGIPAFAVCTSGTAAMNYGPAVAEAFYQQVPLLAITADRPAALIDNGHGQSIRQTHLFDDHVVAKGLLDDRQTLEWNAEVIRRALAQLRFGPVHLNVPLAEPLYDAVVPRQNLEPLVLDSPSTELRIPQFVRQARHPLLVLGQWNPSWGDPEPAVRTLTAKGWVAAAEPLSQLPHDAAEHLEDTWSLGGFEPDAVVTLGGAWVAKKAKLALKTTPHWAIGPREPLPDMFGNLVERSLAAPMDALAQLAEQAPDLGRSAVPRRMPAAAVQGWHDLALHQALATAVPEGWDLHWANSTPVRYANFWWGQGAFGRGIRHFSNRGASGIDGMTSTALGAAWVSGRPTLLVTGELGFLYDGGAGIAYDALPSLKVLVINNQGGQIFQWLDGPRASGLLDRHFAFRHARSVRFAAENQGFTYRSASNGDEFRAQLHAFLTDSAPAVFEVYTDPDASERAWKGRFGA